MSNNNKVDLKLPRELRQNLASMRSKDLVDLLSVAASMSEATGLRLSECLQHQWREAHEEKVDLDDLLHELTERKFPLPPDYEIDSPEGVLSVIELLQQHVSETRAEVDETKANYTWWGYLLAQKLVRSQVELSDQEQASARFFLEEFKRLSSEGAYGAITVQGGQDEADPYQELAVQALLGKRLVKLTKNEQKIARKLVADNLLVWDKKMTLRRPSSLPSGKSSWFSLKGT